jgi:hypothetical protein
MMRGNTWMLSPHFTQSFSISAKSAGETIKGTPAAYIKQVCDYMAFFTRAAHRVVVCLRPAKETLPNSEPLDRWTLKRIFISKTPRITQQIGSSDHRGSNKSMQHEASVGVSPGGERKSSGDFSRRDGDVQMMLPLSLFLVPEHQPGSTREDVTGSAGCLLDILCQTLHFPLQIG